jgi:hypothetical protein
MSDWSEPGRSSRRRALIAGWDGRLFVHDEQGDETKQTTLSVKAGQVNVSQENYRPEDRG